MVGEMFSDRSIANLDFSMTTTFSCSPLVFNLIVSSVFEYSIAILGACAALLQQMLVRAWMKRELFYWTQKLHCKMEELEREVNPFKLSTLRKWLDDSSARIQNSSINDLTRSASNSSASISDGGQAAALAQKRDEVAAAFWAIPMSELTLVQKVAAGAGGSVWKANFRGHEVAAKQLYSMQVRTPRTCLWLACLAGGCFCTRGQVCGARKSVFIARRQNFTFSLMRKRRM